MKEMKIEFYEKDYAWGVCDCGNTVKFSGVGAVGCCPAPACSNTTYIGVIESHTNKKICPECGGAGVVIAEDWGDVMCGTCGMDGFVQAQT
jgi:ribosomal protein S27AE